MTDIQYFIVDFPPATRQPAEDSLTDAEIPATDLTRGPSPDAEGCQSRYEHAVVSLGE